MEVLSLLGEALARGERLVLATILNAEGSTPLPAGAHMAVPCGGGPARGTVGGGVLEAQVQSLAASIGSSGAPPSLAELFLTEETGGNGMLCGGSVEVLLEPLGDGDAELFRRLAESREAGPGGLLVRILAGSPLVVEREFLTPPPSGGELEAALGQMAGGRIPGIRIPEEGSSRNLQEGRPLRVQGEGVTLVLEPVTPHHDLFVFGGGHVSRCLVRSAAHAGFRVSVADDRKEFSLPGRFPEAFRTVCAPWERVWDHLRVGQGSFLVIVTRGHSFDAALLETALRTPARYIGMIGSERKVSATFERLLQRGTPLGDLRRVHAPVGLAIGAVSPEEIAVSITAELVAVRRGIRPDGPMVRRLEPWFRARETDP
ncbi:MAG: XdhC family protein [Bacteroidota bacterium]